MASGFSRERVRDRQLIIISNNEQYDLIKLRCSLNEEGDDAIQHQYLYMRTAENNQRTNIQI